MCFIAICDCIRKWREYLRTAFAVIFVSGYGCENGNNAGSCGTRPSTIAHYVMDTTGKGEGVKLFRKSSGTPETRRIPKPFLPLSKVLSS